MLTNPVAPATRDLNRVGAALLEAATEMRIAERAATGRLAWGFQTTAERRATLADARRALDAAERAVRDARRLIDLTEDSL